MKRIPVAALLLIVASLVSCKTKDVGQPPRIAVPQNLTEYQVRLAVASGTVDQPIPQEFTNSEAITDRAFKAALWPFYKSPQQASEGGWFLESMEKGLVIAAYQRKTALLRVEIQFDSNEATIRIVEARNLRYDGSKIHKGALLWLSELEARIRRSLGQASLAVG